MSYNSPRIMVQWYKTKGQEGIANQFTAHNRHIKINGKPNNDQSIYKIHLKHRDQPIYHFERNIYFTNAIQRYNFSNTKQMEIDNDKRPNNS